MRPLLLLAVLAAAPVLWAAWAHVREDRSERLLRAAATAHERAGYRGTAVERSGGSRHEVLVEHDAATGRTACAWGGFREVRAAPSTRTPDPAGWCVDVDALLAGYRAEAGDEVSYLGRPARKLRVLPRHPGRPSFDLVLDAASGLPLEVATFGGDGEPYRVTCFREVSIGPRTVAGEPRPAPFEGTPVPPGDLERRAGFPLLLPDYLPPGFRCIGASVAHLGPPAAVLFYSDGGTLAELRQSPVWTPARTEAALVRQMGPAHAARWTEHIRRTRPGQAEGGGEGSVARRRWWRHVVYDLRVGDVDVRLTSRADFDQEESLRLLRSLRTQ